MQLRWTEDAAADLEQIADYLFEHAPRLHIFIPEADLLCHADITQKWELFIASNKAIYVAIIIHQ